jgi:hypothetical protein
LGDWLAEVATVDTPKVLHIGGGWTVQPTYVVVLASTGSSLSARAVSLVSPTGKSWLILPRLTAAERPYYTEWN